MGMVPILLLALATAPPTAQDVIDRIKKNVNCSWRAETVDTIKAGSGETPVKGIAVTFLATLDVLQRAAASGANLVITHEPTFYQHLENTKPIEGDAVLEAKRAFIEKNKMVVWRFHDHWHMHKPDGVITGMTAKLGWEKYRKPGNAPIFTLPKTTVAQLASELKKTFGARTMRVIGKPEMPVSTVALVPGAPGSVAHMRTLGMEGIDIVVGGEAPEWESIVYAHDAMSAGKNKALILLGHAHSEEAGMEYCAKWLETFVKDVPVKFVPAGEPFWSPR
jgi:putative NIF3 family GTP cyclohydrolase 1 type 2